MNNKYYKNSDLRKLNSQVQALIKSLTESISNGMFYYESNQQLVDLLKCKQATEHYLYYLENMLFTNNSESISKNDINLLEEDFKDCTYLSDLINAFLMSYLNLS